MPAEKTGLLRRAGETCLKVLGLFLILEPVWMLLPFAGFLYGSAFHIQALARSPWTAWLTHFVFPVLCYGLLGPVLALLGLALFLAGAFQVYSAKLRETGLVTTGLYRFVRHPQYVSLTLFGVGALLTWGRAAAFVAFFLMMFLYYHLARSEERRCLALFGEAYERYRERTSFVFPGDRALRGVAAGISGLRLPPPLRVVGGLVLTLVVCLASMLLIDSVKRALLVVPFLTASVELTPLDSEGRAAGVEIASAVAGGVQFVHDARAAVVRGPYRNAAAPGFAERVLRRLPRSDALRDFLAFLDDPAGDVAIAFGLPFHAPETSGRTDGDRDAEGRGPPPDPAGPDRARLLVMRASLPPGSGFAEAFTDPESRSIRGALMAPVDLDRPGEEDLVAGPVFRPGPGFPGEERFRFLLDQLSERPVAGAGTGPAAVPGGSDLAELVLVQAPILRTRRDPEFAREILLRLVRSEAFRNRLSKVGAGGEVVPVAFPRPGPNWYEEHHGKPQISLFVVLTRGAAADSPSDLFRPGGRELLGAFTAEMDFGIDPAEDSVGSFQTIGRRRDLEERFRFFLSGL